MDVNKTEYKSRNTRMLRKPKYYQRNNHSTCDKHTEHKLYKCNHIIVELCTIKRNVGWTNKNRHAWAIIPELRIANCELRIANCDTGYVPRFGFSVLFVLGGNDEITLFAERARIANAGLSLLRSERTHTNQKTHIHITNGYIVKYSPVLHVRTGAAPTGSIIIISRRT